MGFTLFGLSLAAIGIYFVKRLFTPQPRCPLPPGPRGYPLIGNLLDVPTGRQWLGWSKHKDLYGPISRLNLFGMNLIIIHDMKMAVEMFDKRSTVYSDRPNIMFGCEIVGWETVALLHYGERHRTIRKQIHQVIGSRSALSRFNPFIEVESRRLLLRILNDPSKLLTHVHRSTAAVILKISYGYEMEPNDIDPVLEVTEEGIAQISSAAQPGSFLVDLLPLLKYVPEWVPGTKWKRTARRYKATLLQLVEKPYLFVKQQMANGSAVPSYTHDLLEKSSLTPAEESIIKWSAASLYTGGADTTVSTIQAFFLAMLMNPDVAAKGRAEIDAVIGSDRLPTFEDRIRLPYINAIVKETIRWHPVVPMGLPHVNEQDDIFREYYIPKGSIIMPNIWGFSKDPSMHSQPYEFLPERFIGGEAYGGKLAEQDVMDYAFGFGRRVCPGSLLADSSLFMAAAMSLATLDFNKAIDSTGQVIEPKFEFVEGVLTHPAPFESACVPRSAQAAALIRSVEEDHPWDSTDAKTIANMDWENPIHPSTYA